MALRNIVVEGDPILSKSCKEVAKVSERTAVLLDDMIETMRHNKGVGLAAPQVGILRRMAIIEPEEGLLYEFINPIVISTTGIQEGYEGCLSVPGYIGKVERPESIKIRSLNRTGGQETFELQGFAAVAACHELDHLDGVLYTSKAEDVHRLPEGLENEDELEGEDE